MPTFYDWLMYKKGISKDIYDSLSKDTRITLKKEWCRSLWSKLKSL